MTRNVFGAIGLLTLLFAFTVGQVRAADEPDAEPAPDKQDRSLDDDLLKSLGDEESDDAKPGDKAAKHEAGADGSRELDDELMRGLDDGEDIGEENPLVKVGRQMREVEELIGGEKTGEQTQELQKGIVEQCRYIPTFDLNGLDPSVIKENIRNIGSVYRINLVVRNFR